MIPSNEVFAGSGLGSGVGLGVGGVAGDGDVTEGGAADGEGEGVACSPVDLPNGHSSSRHNRTATTTMASATIGMAGGMVERAAWRARRRGDIPRIIPRACNVTGESYTGPLDAG